MLLLHVCWWDNLPIRFTFSLRTDAAYNVATTHAAPPMSPLISSMLALGFRLMPPLSNVTPLPAYSYHQTSVKLEHDPKNHPLSWPHLSTWLIICYFTETLCSYNCFCSLNKFIHINILNDSPTAQSKSLQCCPLCRLVTAGLQGFWAYRDDSPVQ